MATPPGRAGRPWRTVQAQVYREETHCWLCHQPVDPSLPPNHPHSRSADHLVQLTHGGPPLARTNLHLAHRRCNTVRGNKLRNLDREHCACSQGQPCARLTPRATLMVNIADL